MLVPCFASCIELMTRKDDIQGRTQGKIGVGIFITSKHHQEIKFSA